METTGITVSPVNMEDRRSIGIKAGDTVRVHQKIQDKGKTRIQVFEGLVLARKHGNEPGATFTVRKMVDGIGVEKIYPLYSPMIDKIEITRRSKVRRAKLYYIREKVAREIKRQMRRMRLVELATESELEAKARAEAKAAEEARIQEEKEKEAAQAAEAKETETNEDGAPEEDVKKEEQEEKKEKESKEQSSEEPETVSSQEEQKEEDKKEAA